MTTVLAIDTSTEIASVAALRDGQLLAEIEEADAARHDVVLLPRIDAVLRSAGLTLAEVNLLAVGLGPGAFGGLRVGLATMQGLALATNIASVGVSSLAALACRAPADATHVATLIDANRGELYAAVYARSNAGLQQLLAPFVADPSDAADRIREACAGTLPFVVGRGAFAHRQALLARWPQLAVDTDAAAALPSARHVATIALAHYIQHGAQTLADLIPIYVRDSDAKLPARPLELSSD